MVQAYRWFPVYTRVCSNGLFESGPFTQVLLYSHVSCDLSNKILFKPSTSMKLYYENYSGYTLVVYEKNEEELDIT